MPEKMTVTSHPIAAQPNMGEAMVESLHAALGERLQKALPGSAFCDHTTTLWLATAKHGLREGLRKSGSLPLVRPASGPVLRSIDAVRASIGGQASSELGLGPLLCTAMSPSVHDLWTGRVHTRRPSTAGGGRPASAAKLVPPNLDGSPPAEPAPTPDVCSRELLTATPEGEEADHHRQEQEPPRVRLPPRQRVFTSAPMTKAEERRHRQSKLEVAEWRVGLQNDYWAAKAERERAEAAARHARREALERRQRKPNDAEWSLITWQQEQLGYREYLAEVEAEKVAERTASADRELRRKMYSPPPVRDRRPKDLRGGKLGLWRSPGDDADEGGGGPGHVAAYLQGRLQRGYALVGGELDELRRKVDAERRSVGRVTSRLEDELCRGMALTAADLEQLRKDAARERAKGAVALSRKGASARRKARGKGSPQASPSRLPPAGPSLAPTMAPTPSPPAPSTEPRPSMGIGDLADVRTLAARWGEGLRQRRVEVSNADVNVIYALGDELGEGATASVRRATLRLPGRAYGVSRDGVALLIPGTVAIKTMLKTNALYSATDVQREVSCLRAASHHPNVATLYEVYQTPTATHLVLQLAAGGELFDHLVERGSLSELEAISAVRDLCLALADLHAKGIVHRDLKADNLLIEPAAASESRPGGAQRLLLADFGLARQVPTDGSLMREACGSPAYAAPEILTGEGYSGTASDMWSVGVIIYMLLCGYPPFNADGLTELHAAIKAAKYSFPSPEWDAVAPEAKRLIASLLQLDPKQRPTANQVLAEYEWLQ